MRKFCNFSIIVAVTLIAVSAARAQTGSITGTVKDPSGAVVPAAHITITNLGTNAPRTAETNDHGEYMVTLLPVGSYKIKAEFHGFKTGLAENIMLNINDELRIDFSLEVGTTSENVVVTESAPLVQSETSSVGQVIDNVKVVELPLNGRNFATLTTLVPGTVFAPMGSSFGFSAAGSRQMSNQTLVDGVNDNDALNNNAVAPIVDSIQEFKVLSSTYSAEFGTVSGGQVAVSTKSGTNNFHGSAWEFLRNDDLDARDYFARIGTVAKNPYKRNQYGATAGGAIQRDKTFFFAAFEGTNIRPSNPVIQTVPTSTWNSGDLSSLLPVADGGACTGRGCVQLVNPFTGQNFVNNQISPTSFFSPVTNQILALNLWPTATGSGTASNWTGSLADPTNVYNSSVRIDHRFSDKDTLFGRFAYSHSLTDQPCSSGRGTPNCVPGYGQDVYSIGQNIALNEVHIFNGNLVNEAHLGFARSNGSQLPADAAGPGNAAAQHGLFTSIPGSWGLPDINTSGAVANVGSANYMPHISSTYLAADTVTYNKGTHSLRFGFDGRAPSFPATIASPIGLSFNGSFTGNAYADFLLGLPYLTTQNPLAPDISYQRDQAYAVFVQDDWKATNRLTLNLGLRYEYNVPGTEKHNHLAQVNVLTGAYEIAGQNGASDAMYNADATDFEPRFGFAFRPTGSSNSVIRGGYGIFHDLANLANIISPLRQDPPYTTPYQYQSPCAGPKGQPLQLSCSGYASVQTYLASANAITSSTPFPASYSQVTVTNLVNAALTAINPNLKNPLVQQWNLGYQRELGNNMVVEISYVGNHGTRVFKALDYNQAVLGSGSVQSRRLWTQYGSLKTLDSSGYDKYNALDARFEKRLSGGLSFLGSYTYSHCIDNASSSGMPITQDFYNQAADEGNCDIDARQRLAMSYVYNLPFGRGQRFGNAMPSALNFVAGGWQFSGISQFQTGLPFMLAVGSDNSNTGDGAMCPGGCDVPNLAPGVNPYEPRGTFAAGGAIQYLNPAAFSMPASGAFGDMPRNLLRAKGIETNDWVMSKNFKAGERFNTEFRAELFNALNTPLQAATPSGPTTSLTPVLGQLQSSSTLLPNRQVEFGLKLTF